MSARSVLESACVPPATGFDQAALTAAVLEWYAQFGRQLSFRRTRDPYAVLVSETMAQQTQISRVGPAWERFMALFPTIQVLAAASTADVLRAWQGLGYNRRALNLQRTARAIVTDHRGAMPRSVDVLERLPGIGPYTARAVAAIAFDQPFGAVDTNVRRVLGRIVVGVPAKTGDRAIQDLADELAPAHGAGQWTHALMDVGALFCRPRRPLCEACPAVAWCEYARADSEAAAPRPARPAPRAWPSPIRFEETTRWLRGRILDRLRAAGGSSWDRLDEPIGLHTADAVRAMLPTLAAEGLVELDPADPTRARLPR